MADDLTLTDHTGSASDPAAPPPSPPAAGSPLGPESVPAPERGESAAPESLADHEASFEGERDEQGRFVKARHRARSQKAGPQDVPRIAELTRRLREAEAERDRLKSGAPSSPASPPGPSPAASSRPAPSAPPAVASFTPVKAASEDPEPQQEAYDDFSKWVRDHNRWSAREEIRSTNERHSQWQKEQQTQAEVQRIARSWQERTTAALAKYPDFKQVALDAPTLIPQGSLVDAWILEHKAGADVLYFLQKSPDDLQRILQMPLMEQVEELTLLAQRLTSPNGRQPAVATGAVAASPISPVPRPPTPVRTAPMRTGTELPGDDASLSEHEKAYHSGTGRRR